MAHYIDEDALVAEIERQQRKLCVLSQSKEVELGKNAAIQNGVYCSLLSFIDTLEVKEVDLEKELIEWHKEHFKKDGTFIGMSGFYLTNNSQRDIAKHFFELGLKAKQG